ncbi:hypothetical protein H3N89_gp30 [Microbacterium phage MonChoix]|uniref:Uncharacterized protein n=1 Tax=Microbacterium phage MonChoix TaxID=2590880 RepID=A0A4Y6EDC9_9CAUD|nr:hypothetical protein H3N89_gp30 [Microbacterium phage MonChoix]QDF15995.1 hypothetical protein SEA_MONCHOIX_30 [Microbacterium phage MonChoix]
MRKFVITTVAVCTLVLGWAVFTLAFSPAAALEPTPATPTQGAPIVEETPELPEWAQGQLWIIYPEGFQCVGTEGCPNNYLSIGGEVGPVLPEGVEYYDPEKHDCYIVQPVGVTC